MRPKARRRTPKSIFPTRDSILGKWVIWENFSSEPSALPSHLSIIRSQRSPIQDPRQCRRCKSPPSPVQHSGQLPATLRARLPETQDARKIYPTTHRCSLEQKPLSPAHPTLAPIHREHLVLLPSLCVQREERNPDTRLP